MGTSSKCQAEPAIGKSVADGIKTKKSIRDRICVCLAGAAAEEIVFGAENRSTGATTDLDNATNYASYYFRRYGFGNTLGRIDSAASQSINHSTNIEPSNGELEALLQEEMSRAKKIITDNMAVFKQIIEKVINHNTVKQSEFIELVKNDMPELKLENNGELFHDIWQSFAKGPTQKKVIARTKTKANKRVALKRASKLRAVR